MPAPLKNHPAPRGQELARMTRHSSLRCFPLWKPLLTLLESKHKATHANIIYSRLLQFACQFELVSLVRLTRSISLFDCLQVLAKAKAKGLDS